MITTAILNDPKPARGVNWAGHPMKEGEDYYGKTVTDAPESPAEAPASSPDPALATSPRRKRDARQKAAWTPEKRKLFGDRMRERMAKWRAAHVDVGAAAPTKANEGEALDS